LYTIYKALTAVALARQLTATSGRPVVPVFWVAGDDHDFAESNHAHILTTENEVQRLALRDRLDSAAQLPLYREALGEEVMAALASLDAGTPDTEFKRGILECTRRHYRPENDVATAHAGFLTEVLGRFGLVVFQPYHPAAKQVAAPLLMRALTHAAEIDDLLVRRAMDLKQDGAPAPIKVGNGETTVMIEAKQGRDRLVLAGDVLTARRSGERWALDELEHLASTDPSLFSPNVLLRPAVEAALLPTIAYVAGPGELAYLPQADPLYTVLDAVPQAMVARWGGVVLEHRVSRVLEKLAISIDDLSLPAGQLEARLVRDEMPGEASRALNELRRAMSREYERLTRAATRIDPTLEKPIRSEAHKGLRGVGEMEKKLIGHLKKRNATVAGQIAKARVNIYPLGRPQERVLNALPYLVRYGDEFLDMIVEQCTTLSAALETAPGDT
jgi:bacillithiol biosynthesis cysteine-adding enzyme BshC